MHRENTEVDRLQRVTDKLRNEGYPLTEEERARMQKSKRFEAMEDLPLLIQEAMRFLYEHRHWRYTLRHRHSKRSMGIEVSHRGNLSVGFGGSDWAGNEQNRFLRVANRALCEEHDIAINKKVSKA